MDYLTFSFAICLIIFILCLTLELFIIIFITDNPFKFQWVGKLVMIPIIGTVITLTILIVHLIIKSF